MQLIQGMLCSDPRCMALSFVLLFYGSQKCLHLSAVKEEPVYWAAERGITVNYGLPIADKHTVRRCSLVTVI